MTEKELLIGQPKQLFKLSQLINDGTISMDDLSEIIPGIMHVNSRTDLGIEYISKQGCDLLGYSLEELNQLGGAIFEKHQSEYTRTVTYGKLMNELAKDDIGHVIPFFQDWQYKEDGKPVFHFTSTKILNENQLISISLFPPEIEYLTNKVNNLFGMNNTLETYFLQYSTLTKREKQILAHLGNELSRKEISMLLFIDPKTVKKHCENIFKKLGTNKRLEIKKIADAFRLI